MVKQGGPVKERRKGIIQDSRIFLKTVRQVSAILQVGGVDKKIKEQDLGEQLEVTICMGKQKKKRDKRSNPVPSQAVIG